EVAVGTERELAGVVIGELRMLDREQDGARGWVRYVRIGGRPGEALDDVLAAARIARARPRVVDVEAAVGGVLRVEGEAEEALLAAGLHEARDVEERRGNELAVADHADAPGLLHHEEASREIVRMRDLDRGREPRDEGLER